MGSDDTDGVAEMVFFCMSPVSLSSSESRRLNVLLSVGVTGKSMVEFEFIWFACMPVEVVVWTEIEW